MKRFLSILALLAIVVSLSLAQVEATTDTVLRGQNITAGEYYINSGSAVPITIGPPEDEITAAITPPLSEGDTVRVRFRSSTGEWSALRTIIFRVPYPSSSFSLTEGEYRINSGAWTALPSLPSTTFSPPGFGPGDTIRTRYKSSSGLWSAQRALIYQTPSPTSENKLTQLEWSVNSGTPNTSNISPPLSEDVRTILPGTLNEGDTIKVRYKSWNGLWSETRRIVYQSAYPAAENRITQGEWFLNADPGEGNGTPVTIGFPLPEVSIPPFTPPGYSDGDVIHVRFKSTNGIWGRPRSLVKKPPLQIGGNRIVAGEWFLNTDPGPGSGTAFPGPFDSTEISKTFSPPITGNSVVFVRFKNSNMVWGPPHPFPQSADANVTSGWNLLSIGYSVLDPRKVTLFPTALSLAYSFVANQGYAPKDSLEIGKGYWLKFDSSQTIAIQGLPVAHDTISVSSGWNLIGSIAQDVATSSIQTIPPGIVISQYFGYQGSYSSASVLKPWTGYWVKVSQSGVLVLGVGSFPPIASTTQQESNLVANANKLTIGDASGRQQTLYVRASLPGTVDADYFELPPPPPEGLFDARFTSNRFMEISQEHETVFPISVSSATFPLTITWEASEGYKDAFLKVGEEHIKLSEQAIQLNSLRGPLVLHLNEDWVLPKEFRLHQNYPNPFNPITTIRYQLPIDSRVTLKIFNILGQEVKTLVDEVQKAGYRSVEWDSRNNHGLIVGSGVYFCQIRCEGVTERDRSYVQFRKMVLLK